jgi:hypothetical protein
VASNWRESTSHNATNSHAPLAMRFAEDVVAPPTAADEHGAEPRAAGFGLRAEGKRNRREGSRGGGGLEKRAAVHFWGGGENIFNHEWTRMDTNRSQFEFVFLRVHSWLF